MDDKEAYHSFCFKGALSHEGLGRRPLTEQQMKVYNLARVGWKPANIAERVDVPLASVYDALHSIQHKGWTY